MNNTAYVMVYSVMKMAILMAPLWLRRPLVIVYPLPIKISINMKTRTLPDSNRRAEKNKIIKGTHMPDSSRRAEENKIFKPLIQYGIRPNRRPGRLRKFVLYH